MRHDLIMRALRLPLLAALCICTALVAVTAHGLPSRDPQNAALPRGSGNFYRTPTEPHVAGSGRRLANDRPTITPGQPDRAIDWNGIAAVAAEHVARSGGMLGRWLVTLRDMPADEATEAEDETADREGVEATVRAARADGNPPDRPASAIPPNATSIPTTATAAEVHLSNPAENGLPVSFLMGEQVVLLAADEGRSFADAPVTVRFDRGGRFGSATKTLTVGRYEFRLSANGWDIVADSP